MRELEQMWDVATGCGGFPGIDEKPFSFEVGGGGGQDTPFAIWMLGGGWTHPLGRFQNSKNFLELCCAVLCAGK